MRGCVLCPLPSLGLFIRISGVGRQRWGRAWTGARTPSVRTALGGGAPAWGDAVCQLLDSVACGKASAGPWESGPRARFRSGAAAGAWVHGLPEGGSRGPPVCSVNTNKLDCLVITTSSSRGVFFQAAKINKNKGMAAREVACPRTPWVPNFFPGVADLHPVTGSCHPGRVCGFPS